MVNVKNKAIIAGAALTLALVGCGGFVYTSVGGNVKGLTTDSLSVLTLGNEANFTSVLNADGPFSFRVASNGTYSIRVATQPNPVHCSITNGTGKMTGETPVTNVAVNCVPNVQLSGTLSGLVTGTSLGISTKSGVSIDSTTVAISQPPLLVANGTFTLPNYIVSGYKYSVDIYSQPAAQVCSVLNGEGTADNTNLAAAKNVAVNCVPGVPVGVTLAGLKTGLFVTLANNGDDLLSMTAIGTGTFNKSLLNGAPYAITIATQPVGQTCTVTNGTGTAVLNTPVTAINVAITCV
ncbi:MAG: hypothetical protein Q7U12_02825 [Undibacterium sp.]|nr:hypothetical protein [Undibacterium sp.]